MRSYKWIEKKKKKKKKKKNKNMGAFLSHLVGKLLGDSKPLESGGEIDGTICVCCGTLNLADAAPGALHVEHEKDSDQERTDGDDKDFVH